MGKNQLIHGNEFHLLKQAEIHKATGKLVESLNLAAVLREVLIFIKL